MSKVVKFLLVLIIFVFIILGAAYYYNSLGSLSDQEAGIILKEKKATSSTRDYELSLVMDRAEKTEASIRETVLKNKDLITKSNCKGLFYDLDNEGFYKKTIFDQKFKLNEPLVIHYNFCSFTWNTQQKISLMLTTRNLLLEHKEINDYGVEFIPTYVFKKVFLENGEPLVESEIGLLSKEEILSY